MLLELVWSENMSFGSNLKSLRRDKGWTQLDLAKESGLKSAHIPKLEKDKSDPKLSTIYKLTNALGVSPNALLLDSEEMSLNSRLEVNFERLNSLKDLDKRILIDLIDKYCIASGLEETVNFKKSQILKFRVMTDVERQLTDEDKREIEQDMEAAIAKT